MIRRDSRQPDGSPGWILIPQISHAHLSGDLADRWLFDLVDDDFVHSLRYAARHHDDGWAAWDERPGLDSDGVPVKFDQMRLADSLSIWERSIELSTIHAPLAGYLVAGHFCRLLHRFTAWQENPATASQGTDFLSMQAAKMAAQLAAWQFADQPHRPPELPELGVSLVQMFDAISLWFCCAERTDSCEAKLPEGRSWTFSPVGPNQVTVDPWPLDQPTLTLTAAGRSVARARYRTTDELLSAVGEQIELGWQLVSRG